VIFVRDLPRITPSWPTGTKENSHEENAVPVSCLRSQQVAASEILVPALPQFPRTEIGIAKQQALGVSVQGGRLLRPHAHRRNNDNQMA